MVEKSDQRSRAETDERITKVLRGAFAGPPTPLKDIPTKTGDKRGRRKPRAKRPRNG